MTIARKALTANPVSARAALTTEFPTALDRTVRPGLRAAPVLVIGSARRLRLLPVEGFAELALGLVLLPRVRFSHTGSLA
jgi:hypothetical protein